jgi:predicted phage tail protein
LEERVSGQLDETRRRIEFLCTQNPAHRAKLQTDLKKTTLRLVDVTKSNLMTMSTQPLMEIFEKAF